MIAEKDGSSRSTWNLYSLVFTRFHFTTLYHHYIY